MAAVTETAASVPALESESDTEKAPSRRKRKRTQKRQNERNGRGPKLEKSEETRALLALAPVRSRPLETEGGFVNIDKAPMMTSHDCVSVARHLLRTTAIGHGGTLDPLATGVLPLAVGRATRLLQYLPQDKAYRCTIRLGVSTDTDDITGEVVARTPAPHLSREEVEGALRSFVGVIKQVPPSFSAIWVDGKRMHELARSGQEVPELPARDVIIYNLRVLDHRPGDFPEVDIHVHCGPGTYIRSIGRDLGAALGCGGTVAVLRRTMSHGFDESSGISLDQLNDPAYTMQSMDQPLHYLRSVVLEDEEATLWVLGRQIHLPLDRPEAALVQLPELKISGPGDDHSQSQPWDGQTPSRKDIPKKPKHGEIVLVYQAALGAARGRALLGLGRLQAVEAVPGKAAAIRLAHEVVVSTPAQ